MDGSESEAGQRRPPVIFLMGPTASGKTDIAMSLRHHMPVDIISVDSALVYRGLNIGAAKPSAAELLEAPHRLLDIRDPSESYSAADFCSDAMEAITSIHEQGRIPLLVGGTMMYFKALKEGLADMPAAQPEFRAEIEARAEREGWPALHQWLQALDPDVAAKIHPNHSHRIARALEICIHSRHTVTELRNRQHQAETGQDFEKRFNLVQLALGWQERSLLHKRIAERFNAMLSAGFIDEVAALQSRGDLHESLPAIRSVGYRQVWQFLHGEFPEEELRERGIAATRQLAKRQLTWLRKWNGAETFFWDSPAGRERKKVAVLDEILIFLGKRTL